MCINLCVVQVFSDSRKVTVLLKVSNKSFQSNDLSFKTHINHHNGWWCTSVAALPKMPWISLIPTRLYPRLDNTRIKGKAKPNQTRESMSKLNCEGLPKTYFNHHHCLCSLRQCCMYVCDYTHHLSHCFGLEPYHISIERLKWFLFQGVFSMNQWVLPQLVGTIILLLLLLF